MPTALSRTQKRILAQLSDRAFARVARARGLEDTAAARAEFRHAEVARACSKLGLRCCSQDDYAGVKAHFENLLGEGGRALKTLMHGEGNQRRVVEHKIAEVLGALRAATFYADAICRRMFRGVNMLEASVGQLWKLFYALNKELRKRGGGSHGDAQRRPTMNGGSGAAAPDAARGSALPTGEVDCPF